MKKNYVLSCCLLFSGAAFGMETHWLTNEDFEKMKKEISEKEQLIQQLTTERDTEKKAKEDLKEQVNTLTQELNISKRQTSGLIRQNLTQEQKEMTTEGSSEPNRERNVLMKILGDMFPCLRKQSKVKFTPLKDN